MYTGIVEQLGMILSFDKLAGKYRLKIASNFTDFVLGESISVDGICLSVTEFEGHNFYCDLSPETMAVTTASAFKVGAHINLERSLRVGDRLGGHYVMGHVDQTCRLKAHVQHGDCVEMTCDGLTDEGLRYFIPKGSVCINGVSLTVNRVEDDSFTVMLIPDTLQRTNLSELAAGDTVNIEYDFMVKTVVHQLKQKEIA